MICVISGKQTSRRTFNAPLDKCVTEFGKWYRDKLNVEQKEKGTKLIDLRNCLTMFIDMKNKKYSWQNIQVTLVDELMKKGLIEDGEYHQKLDDIRGNNEY